MTVVICVCSVRKSSLCRCMQIQDARMQFVVLTHHWESQTTACVSVSGWPLASSTFFAEFFSALLFCNPVMLLAEYELRPEAQSPLCISSSLSVSSKPVCQLQKPHFRIHPFPCWATCSTFFCMSQSNQSILVCYLLRAGRWDWSFRARTSTTTVITQTT